MEPARGTWVTEGLIALALGLLWGFTFLAIKWGLRDAGPLTLAALRVLIGAIGLIVVAWRGAGPMPMSGRAHRQIAAVGLIQVAAFSAFLNLGTSRAGIGVASLIVYSQPAIVAVLAVVWLGERLRGVQVARVLLGLAGLVLVVSGQIGVEAAIPWSSYLLLAGAALAWAVGAMLFRRLKPALPFLWAIALQTIYGGIPIGIAAVVIEGPEVRVTARLVALSLFLGFGASGLAYLLWFRLLTGPSAVAASTSLLLVPLCAAVFGSVALRETWTALSVAGASCIVGSIFLVNRGLSPAGRPGDEPRPKRESEPIAMVPSGRGSSWRRGR